MYLREREKGKQNFKKKEEKSIKNLKAEPKKQTIFFFEWKVSLTTNWMHKASKRFFKLMVKLVRNYCMASLLMKISSCF